MAPALELGGEFREQAGLDPGSELLRDLTEARYASALRRTVHDLERLAVVGMGPRAKSCRSHRESDDDYERIDIDASSGTNSPPPNHDLVRADRGEVHHKDGDLRHARGAIKTDLSRRRPVDAH